MTLCARRKFRAKAGEPGRQRCALPAIAGPTAFGGIPTPWPLLVSEDSAGSARRRVVARQGFPPERRFDEQHACHRKSDGGGTPTHTSTHFRVDAILSWPIAIPR